MRQLQRGCAMKQRSADKNEYVVSSHIPVATVQNFVMKGWSRQQLLISKGYLSQQETISLNGEFMGVFAQSIKTKVSSWASKQFWLQVCILPRCMGRTLLVVLTTMILMIPLMSIFPLPPPPWVFMLLPILVFGALVAQALFHAEVHHAQVHDKQFDNIL